MTKISTDISDFVTNSRIPLKQPTSHDPAPPVDIFGTVAFDIVPNNTTGTISLSISEIGGDETDPDRVVGIAPNGDRYLRVPKDKVVQIDCLLTGVWKWNFPRGADGVTLATSGHEVRYWLIDKANPKMRRIIIKSSGLEPQANAQSDDGRHDEKFNLQVEIKQAHGKPLAIEIDPITKNPPPGNGKSAPLGEPGALL
jgi:hypothetical protein